VTVHPQLIALQLKTQGYQVFQRMMEVRRTSI
jgi:hypothetical protein